MTMTARRPFCPAGQSDGPTADTRRPPGGGAASAQGLCSARRGTGQVSGSVGTGGTGTTSGLNHLGLETAREHHLGGPHEEDTPSTEALGEPHGRGSQPGAHGHPAPPGQGGPPTRRGGRGEPPPGEGKASFCTRRNRADSLKHSLSSS